jgi:hypothetical protein
MALTEIRLSKLFMNSMRTDVYSVSTKGGYNPVKSPIEQKDIMGHLKGDRSLGMFFIFPKECNQVMTLALDIDQDDEPTVNKICKALLNYLPEESILVEKTGGRGWHIWIFFNAPLPASAIRIFAKKTINEVRPGFPIEVYPKQDRIKPDKFGNLMRIPLGIHPRTGEKGGRLFDASLSEISITALDPLLPIIPAEKSILMVAARQMVSIRIMDDDISTNGNGKDTSLPCISQFMEGVNEGMRDEAMFRLAAYLKRSKIPQQAALVTLKTANAKNNPPLEEMVLQTKVNSAYMSGSHGLPCTSSVVGLDTDFCDNKCPVYMKAKRLKSDEGNPSYGANQPLIVENAGGYSLLVPLAKGSKEIRLSNFVIRPSAILEMGSYQHETNEEIIRGDVITSNGNKFQSDIPSSAFITKRNFLTHLNRADVSWFGSDQQLQLLKAWLAAMEDTPRLMASTKLGRIKSTDVWLTEDAAISEEGLLENSEWVYYRPHHYGKLNVAITRATREWEESRKVFKSLLNINELSVMIPVIGWMFAVPHKNLIMNDLGHFPLLMLFGTRGSGKTQLVQRVVLPLFGYNPNEPSTMVCDSTRFVWISFGASTTTIPVFMDEYRPNALGLVRMKSLWDFWRHVYTGDVDFRGQSNLTRIAYQQTSPIIAAGEEMIADPALMERFIQVQMSVDYLTQEVQQAFRDLPPLSPSSLQFVVKSLNLSVEAMKKQAEELLGPDLRKEMSPRIYDSILVITMGLTAWSKLTRTKITKPMLEAAKMVQGMTKGGGDKRTILWVDDFLMDLAGMLEVKGGIWGEIKDSTWMFFNLRLAYSEWAKEVRQKGDSLVRLDTLRRQLREETSTPYIEERNIQKKIHGINRKIYTVNLVRLREMMEE